MMQCQAYIVTIKLVWWLNADGVCAGPESLLRRLRRRKVYLN